ncbi:WD40-repeat-containing domain protein [Pyronema domesticum]|uniref:Similar to Poly(A)+ RNA export protein acc. no. P41838 n=1 Tax=Pyronema omphalodes (strain CBS 100304) TaxID=1076935 RepID=U4LN43_PYROM|nr:WD40-repeat-containing domain protein [Pyronema domesticum]CCX30750.1 Similar to Poly(A)+ RNA export protein; acc. no. P41838 [Pyronema omphalodes CBS 100304]
MSLFSGASTTAASNAAAQAQGDCSQDVQLQSPPDDSISDLSFSSQSEHLAVASWDKKVRIYEIAGDGNSQGKAMYEHDAPVLSCVWSKDGTKLASGGADKQAKLYDISTGQSSQVAAHDAPVKCVRFIQAPQTNAEMLVTGSWDKKLKYWDLRTPNPVATLDMQERVYTLDVAQGLMVVGTAERYINIVNLSNPTVLFKTMQSPLKWQTRVITCFPDASGFAIGSIEGRCAIQYVDDKNSGMNFSFKCHRETPSSGPQNVFSVNAISFHPTFGTFSTAGSDGTFHFWDKDAKHRLKGYPSVGGTIPATAFNRNGTIFAYAVSYDWSKGHVGNNPAYPNKVMLHPIKEDEAKPRPPIKKR